MIGAVVGPDRSLAAVLFLAGPAARTHAARVDHAADAHSVADSVFGDGPADLLYDPRDLVARYEGELDPAPLAASGVDVGVADAGVGDIDKDVFRTEVTPFDAGLLEGGPRPRGGKGGYRTHLWSLLGSGSERKCSLGTDCRDPQATEAGGS